MNLLADELPGVEEIRIALELCVPLKGTVFLDFLQRVAHCGVHFNGKIATCCLLTLDFLAHSRDVFCNLGKQIIFALGVVVLPEVNLLVCRQLKKALHRPLGKHLRQQHRLAIALATDFSVELGNRHRALALRASLHLRTRH